MPGVDTFENKIKLCYRSGELRHRSESLVATTKLAEREPLRSTDSVSIYRRTIGGWYRDRTCGPCRVKAVLYR